MLQPAADREVLYKDGRDGASLRRRWMLLAGLFSALLVAAYLGLVGYFAVYRNFFFPDRGFDVDGSFSSGGDLLDYLLQHGMIDRKDGLLVTWHHAANSKSEMEQALKGSAMVLEADVNIEGLNTLNETGIPIMAHPPAVHSDNTLQEWLDAVIKSKKGIKLDFKSIHAVNPSLDILVKKYNEVNFNRPIWLNADILIGPNVPGFIQPVNASRFLGLIQHRFPNVILSPGWVSLYLPLIATKPYTRKMVEEMYGLVKGLPQRITFPVRAVLLKQAWPHFSWLLSQSPRYSLTLWQGSIDLITVEDLLFFRDNSNIEQIYYDIYEPVLSKFKQIALQTNRSRRFYPGGKLLDYFSHQDLNELQINWFDIGSTELDLMEFLQGNDGGMLILNVKRKANSAIPMVESPEGGLEFPLESALNRILTSSKPWGIFLKIKSQQALTPTLYLLHRTYAAHHIHKPVWVSMDLSYGSFSTPGYIEGKHFIKAINEIFPFVTIAPSWPNEALTHGYTQPLVEDMLNLCQGLWQTVSFQLQAVALGKSWKATTGLLQASPSYTLTVEHLHKQGSYTDGFQGLINIRTHSTRRIYYRLPQDYRNSFHIDVFTS
ncbi:protein FAM151A isoform X1 [Carcharodon carcharias]|uniref:protein FAM151A isoform X1 n=1 Tax=Carcharodon carcharias TaxID=13397 RepID=UPI001B7E6B6F|nr:protein FAM151A isoform X1 [Carcharodon carcharias]